MPIYRFRSVWISDIHLGFSHCQADFLLDFLDSHECQMLYIVGDFIDFWSLRKGGRWPESHSQVIKAILAKARQGTKVIYIPGNHDQVIRDYLGLWVGGIEIIAETVHETIDGRRLLVTHGDELDAMIRCSNRLIKFLGDGIYDLLLVANRCTHLLRRHFNYPYWSLATFLKQHIGKAAAYINRFEQAAVHQALARGFDGVICGHIHKAELRQIGGILYCNDGDWVENCSALVEHPDGTLEILRWVDIAKTRQQTAEAKSTLPELARLN